MVPENSLYPLSWAQQRIWFLAHWESANRAYNIPVSWQLESAASLSEVVSAVRLVIARHPALFVSFAELDGDPVQRLHADREFPLSAHDLTGFAPAERAARLDELVGPAALLPFDLSTGPLVRAIVCALDDGEYVVHLTFHHIAMDGFSLEIIERELAAAVTGALADLVPAAPSYLEHCARQRQAVSADSIGRSLAARLESLRGAPEVLELGRDFARPREFSYRGDTLRFGLDEPLEAAVRDFAERNGVTPYVVLLAAFNAFLQRQTGQTDLVVGSPVTERSDAKLLDVVGLFVNTMVVRTDVSGEPTFAELVDRTRASVLSALDGAALPFDLLVKELVANRTPDHGALVQVLFAYHEQALAGSSSGPVRAREMIPTGTSKLDLTFTVYHQDGRLDVEIEYCTDLFRPSSVEYFFEHWKTILADALANPGRGLGDLRLDSERERELVESWSIGLVPAETDLSDGATIHELVQRQAASAPDAVAVVCGDDSLTYRQLNQQANRTAALLRAAGVTAGSLVGVSGDRSADLVVRLLAVLKAGAGYVPLDLDYPPERLEFLIADSGVSVVLTDAASADRLGAGPWQLVVAETGPDPLPSQSDPATAIDADSAAYVIYTSGSTGRPKGVTVTHRNVVRLLAAAAREFSFGPDDVWSMVHSASFDVSVFEMWGALTTGGRLVVVPYWATRSPDDLYGIVKDERVTVLSQTPTAFVQFEAADARLSESLSLRYVIFAGEALDPASVRGWTERRGAERPQLVNMYGITETTVHSTFRAVLPGDLSAALTNIGRPLADLGIRVLDPSLRPCPVGVVGEMYVSGPGVTRGYLNRMGLTAERFVPDPITGTRLYRSGDLARWTAAGTLEYAGRADTMVKIRGFRVEVAEIETRLREHPGVTGAAVTLRPDDAGAPQLIAYTTVSPAAAVEPAQLRQWLADRLPSHMVPARFVAVAEIPRTPSGKTDYGELPDPGEARPAEAGEYVAPVGSAERLLAEVWATALSVSRVGRHDNFFHLGGDSIRSIRVLGAAGAKGLHFRLQDIFLHPTIAELAAIATTGAVSAAVVSEPFDLLSDEDRALLPTGVVDAYPMAALQVGMVYEMSRDPDRLPYHNVDSLRIRAQFDGPAFDRAVQVVVQRHPILRTALSLTDYSEPIQLVYQQAAMQVGVADLRELAEPAQQQVIRDYLELQRVTAFDHDRPPLFRMQIHRCSEDVFQWTLTEHHGVFDGWSLHSTITEILQVYLGLLRGVEPAAVAPSGLYRDFIALERAATGSIESEEFWRKRLAGYSAPRLVRWPDGSMPGESEQPSFLEDFWYATDALQRYGSLETVLSQELSSALRDLASRLGVPMKSLVVAACLRAVGFATGTTDVLIGVTANGRPEEEGGDEVRGLFLNTLPFRLSLPDGTWSDLVESVFATERTMLPHRRFPLVELQRRLGAEQLVQVNFVYNHFHVISDVLTGGGVEIVDEKIGSFTTVRAEPTNFPLNIGVVRDPLSERVLLALDYHTEALSDAQVAVLRNYFVRALWDLVTGPEDRYLNDSLAGTSERELLETGSAPDQASAGLVHEMVEAQARLSPDAVAVSCEGESLTYRELNRRADRLAAMLRRLGAGPESMVGVCATRSIDLVVQLLGVLKAGAAYVPLDPDYPAERLAFLLADSGVSILVGAPGSTGAFPAGPWQILETDARQAHSDDLDTGTALRTAVADNAAYVIYTSGSTGRPKGVAVTHAAVTRLLHWGREFLQAGADDVWTMFHSPSFDFSVWEMWGALSTGGQVVIVPYWVSRSPADFYRLATDAQVTVLCQTPTAFTQWEAADAQQPRPQALRWVIFGGEALDLGSVSRWSRRHGWDSPQLVNMYGITETTVHVTARILTAEDLTGVLTHIGREVAGLTARVLDEMLVPVAVGAIGELYVGGPRLARGYLGRPGLTAERFVADPWSAEQGGRLYRTGDRVRMRPDGQFEYAGRSDDMVNLKGFRIEPGEIEVALAMHPAVESAVVAVRNDVSGRERLVGYVVPTSALPDLQELRTWLSQRLPEHMLPSRLVVLDVLPTGLTGKVDRAALPAPWEEETVAGPMPRDRTEQVLFDLFSELLATAGIDIDSSFFGLGGDSILAIQLVSAARRAGLSIKTQDVYELRTVRALAEVAQVGTEVRADSPADAIGPVATTPIMAWAEELGGPLDSFSQSILVRAPAGQTSEHLVGALQFLLDQHPALRMRVLDDGVGGWKQEVPPAGSLDASTCLRQVDLTGTDPADRPARITAEATASRELLHPGSGRLIQSVWFDTGAEEQARVLLVAHHFAIDGVSWRILLSSLKAACDAIAQGRTPVPEPEITSLRSWSRKLTEMSAERSVVAQVPAWIDVLQGEPEPLLRRPLDRAVDRYGQLRSLRRTVSASCTAAVLTDAPAAFKAEVNDVLLAALAIAVARQRGSQQPGGRTDVLIALEGHGRDHLGERADLSRTVGWFTGIHPVRLDSGLVGHSELQAGGAAVSLAVAQVKDQLRRIPPSGGYGLLRYLNPDTRTDLQALSEPAISFNYLGRFPVARDGDWTLVDDDELALGGGADPRQPLPYAIEVSAITLDGPDGPGLRIAVSWPAGVIDEATAAGLADGWIAALEAVTASATLRAAGEHPSADLGLISLSQDELDEIEADLSSEGGAN